MNKKMLLLAFGLIVFTACDNQLNQADDNVLSVESSKSAIPTPEEYALSLIKSQNMKRTLSTKSASNKIWDQETKVYTVTLPAQTQDAARSATGSEQTYKVPVCFFNYEDGFAIASADPRIPIVFADVESGSLADTANIMGLDMVVKSIPSIVKESLADFYRQREENMHYNSDSKNAKGSTIVERSFENGYMIIRYYTDKENGSKKYGPLMTTKWGQRSPFNALVKKTCDSGKAPIGCTTIAMAQICNYYKYFKGFPYDWNSLKTAKQNVSNTEAAKFAYDISQTIGIKEEDFNCDGTGATSKEVNNAFKKGGYSTSGLKDYSSSSIGEAIKQGKPVYMSGSEKGAESGHAWVVDGLYSTETIRTIKELSLEMGHAVPDGTAPDDIPEELWERVEDYGTSRTYTQKRSTDKLYCNWGWYGENNGFFLSNTFNPGNYFYNTKLKMIIPSR